MLISCQSNSFLPFFVGTESATVFFLFSYSQNIMRGGALLFSFYLIMNSISLRARFTEATWENKDALIRNIRGDKVIAVVNGLYG